MCGEQNFPTLMAKVVVFFAAVVWVRHATRSLSHVLRDYLTPEENRTFSRRLGIFSGSETTD